MVDHVGKALIDPYPIFEAIGLAPGERVADLGCGRTGHFVFPASRVPPSGFEKAVKFYNGAVIIHFARTYFERN